MRKFALITSALQLRVGPGLKYNFDTIQCYIVTYVNKDDLTLTYVFSSSTLQQFQPETLETFLTSHVYVRTWTTKFERTITITTRGALTWRQMLFSRFNVSIAVEL